MNELTFDELRQIDGGSYEEGRELGHKIGKAFYGACAMYSGKAQRAPRKGHG